MSPRFFRIEIQQPKVLDVFCRILLPVLALLILSPALAFAKGPSAKDIYANDASGGANKYAGQDFSVKKEYPDLVSLSLGAYDPNKPDAKRHSVDYRVEYRWGLSLLPLLSDSFNSVEPLFQVHPTLGIEGNTRGAFYGSGGLVMDIPFSEYGIITWGESVGGFIQGKDPCNMGSVFQIRSQLELGARFENQMRVTAFISHISNAYTGDTNPGAEIAGIYVHTPLSLLGLQ